MSRDVIKKDLCKLASDPKAITKFERVMADARKGSLYLIMAGRGCFTDPRLPGFVATI